MKNVHRKICVGASLLTVAAALGIGSSHFSRKSVVKASEIQAPKFEVDPNWPKPLPNHWILGQTIGLSTDAHDDIWIIHRPATTEQKESYSARKEADCCTPAPDVLEFDAAGNLLRHWGKAAGHDWPTS